MLNSPTECANCGSDIPANARACPDCGADERTGWRESDIYDGVDLPDPAWAEDESPSGRGSSRELAWYWWAAGLAVLIGLILTVLGAR